MDAIKTGTLIVDARKEKGMTQSDLAQRLHVSTQAVSKWERGLNFPDITLMEPLAQTLDLTVTELMAGERNAPPQEEVVRDSLRASLAQFGPRVRKWRLLFLCAAALLLGLGLWRGYIWVRDNTQLLPQPQTVVTHREATASEHQVVNTAGSNAVFLFDVALSDQFQGNYSFQMELWTADGLLKVWELPHSIGNGWASIDEIPRHQSLIVTIDYHHSDQELQYGLSFLGPPRWGALEGMPLANGFSILPMEGRASVDPEYGVVLFRLGLGAPQEGGGTFFRYPVYHNTGIGTAEPPQVHEGEAALLLRMYCE